MDAYSSLLDDVKADRYRAALNLIRAEDHLRMLWHLGMSNVHDQRAARLACEQYDKLTEFVRSS
jgi:hypothetical protein